MTWVVVLCIWLWVAAACILSDLAIGKYRSWTMDINIYDASSRDLDDPYQRGIYVLWQGIFWPVDLTIQLMRFSSFVLSRLFYYTFWHRAFYKVACWVGYQAGAGQDA